MRTYIAAEVRAEMARQRKTQEGAAAVLGKSKQAVSPQWRGDAEFRTKELQALAEWLGVPVEQFLPPGYAIVVGPARTAAVAS